MRQIRFLSVILVFIITIISCSMTSVGQSWSVFYSGKTVTYSGDVYNVKINGKSISTSIPCISLENNSYVPAKEVFGDYLGASVSLDSQTGILSITSGNRKIGYSIKESRVYLNGDLFPAQYPVAIIDSIYLVPLRMTSEYLGFSVGYENSTNSVLINSAGYQGADSEIKPTPTPKSNQNTGKTEIYKSKDISGSVTRIEYGSDGNGEFVQIKSSGSNISGHFLISPNDDCSNYRLGVQLGSSLIDKNGSMDIDYGIVRQVRYAQSDYDNRIASIVIETTKKPDYNAVTDSGLITIYLSNVKNPAPSEVSKPENTPKPEQTPKPTPTPAPTPTPTPPPVQAPSSEKVRYQHNGDTGILSIDGVNIARMLQENSDNLMIDYREYQNILYINLIGYKNVFRNIVVPTGDDIVNGIIVINDAISNQVSIRISGNTDLKFSFVDNDSDNTDVMIQKNTDPLIENRIIVDNSYETVSPTPAPTPIPKPTPTPNPVSGTNQDAAAPTPNPMPDRPEDTLADRGGDQRIGSILLKTVSDKIEIVTSDYSGYNIFRLTNPERIVIDVPNNTITPREKDITNGSILTKVRSSQFDAATARIVLDTSIQSDYDVVSAEGALTIQLKSPENNKISYYNNGTELYYKLSDKDIKRRYLSYKNSIETEDSDKDMAYSFIVPYNLIDLGTGVFKTNDKFIDNIAYMSDKKSGKTYMVMYEKSENTYYEWLTDNNPDEITLKITSTPSTKKDETPVVFVPPVTNTNTTTNNNNPNAKCVVIDAGHGGSEPGTTKGDYPEKWYNLDMALRVEKILSLQGINVNMTRRTDTFVGLYERTDIANNLDADLFVSIHCNSLENNTTYSGTTTYYYFSSYNGKKAAKSIQDEMMKRIGTVDRGIVANSGYVVLKYTNMPAVLVETAFLSNSDDRSKLNDEQFRQKIAEGIAAGITNIINQI